MLAAIFPPLAVGFSLVACLNVFNMPAFFSGLGVLPRGSLPTGGVRLPLGGASGFKLIARGVSLLELFLVVMMGR